MILSDQEIRKRVSDEQLIVGFVEERLQAASYDVAISDSIQVFAPEGRVIELSDEAAIRGLTRPRSIADGYNLSPGELVLISLEETLNLPADLAGHIRPRTSFLRIGLFISDQHINPAYSGRLTIGLQNASPAIFVLRPGVRIGQLVFEQLSSLPSEERLYRNKPDAKYQGEGGFTPSRISAEMIEKRALFEKKLFE